MYRDHSQQPNAWRVAAAKRAQEMQWAQSDRGTQGIQVAGSGLQQTAMGFASGVGSRGMGIRTQTGYMGQGTTDGMALRRPGRAQSGRMFVPPNSQSDGPCHPIGMSVTEAEAENVLARIEESAAKRPRHDAAATAALDAAQAQQLQPLLQSVERELTEVRRQLHGEQATHHALSSKMDQLHHAIDRTSREYRQKVAQYQRGDPETQRKMEKYRTKLEKGEAHERMVQMTESERRTKALRKGVEHCDDAEVRLLASKQSELSALEAKQLLGIAAGTDPAVAAKKLMAKMHPDRVHVEACKAMLHMRFALVQHARDVLAPPQT